MFIQEHTETNPLISRLRRMTQPQSRNNQPEQCQTRTRQYIKAPAELHVLIVADQKTSVKDYIFNSQNRTVELTSVRDLPLAKRSRST